jgi:hypothetical protein
MEFMNRGAQPQAAPLPNQNQRPANSGGKKQRGKVMRIVSALLLVSVGLLIAAVAVFVATSSTKSEKSYLDADKFQAVFLNGGQVYFGKVRELNDKFLTVDNIYYLRVNEQTQQDTANPSQQAQQDISLAKLGCELHGPEDQMVINREQVSFWENLKDDGQVAKAIAEFVRQNPDGQKCTDPAAAQ